MQWIGAQFGICRSLDSGDKSLNMFQNVSGFHVQNFRGSSHKYLQRKFFLARPLTKFP